MQREPLTELSGTPNRLLDLEEEEARHRRLLRLGLAVALGFHLALLLVPMPAPSVAVAQEETTPVVHLVPLPQYAPPPPPSSAKTPQAQIDIPVPEVLLPQQRHEQGGSGAPAVIEPHTIGDLLSFPSPELIPEPMPEPEGPIDVGDAVAPPARLVYVEPIYPPVALKARLTGLVVLQVLLGKDGAVREVTVLRPGSPGMTESAVAAVRQWRYEPALLNGRPVEALMTVTVTFALR